ncbi:MAG: efflux RND transporter periplasmic adaptor subunit [Rhodopila sp.]|nr:efflux RND transporter periplasmic adaptor subunit [Rhodopila sp.]
MNPRHIAWLLGVPALAGTAAIGARWLDGRTTSAIAPVVVSRAAAQTPPARQPLYYRDPSGGADFSPTPRKDAQGRDYIPVYDDAEPQAAAAPAKASPAPGSHGRILYYRDPMGLPDTSPVPKKDGMGMNYVPVYEDEANQPAGTVAISPERVQMLGVRTEAAGPRTMTRTVRAVGTVAVDERRLAVVAPRFEGWIERLFVNETGQTVRRGQPLFQVYSPELAATAQEAAIARRAQADMAQADSGVRGTATSIAAAAGARLSNFGVGSGSGRDFTLTSPMDGVVLEKTAIQGMRFAPGDTLYRIADLSNVWLLADVFERDLGQVRPGQDARIALTAYPDRKFTGKVTFIYPTLDPTTRTGRVRIEIPNPDQLLKPDMYATVEIATNAASTQVLAVPESAVLDSGTQQAALVERSPGHYEPRVVVTGARANGFVEIRSGISPGEKVVVGANFLIDAESNLRAALQAFGAAKPASSGQEQGR